MWYFAQLNLKKNSNQVAFISFLLKILSMAAGTFFSFLGFIIQAGLELLILLLPLTFAGITGVHYHSQSQCDCIFSSERFGETLITACVVHTFNSSTWEAEASGFPL